VNNTRNRSNHETDGQGGREANAAARPEPATIEIDGAFTRREVVDALKRLAFDPRARTRRAVLIDRDVRDLLIDILDR
jgi:hypothetical protein